MTSLPTERPRPAVLLVEGGRPTGTEHALRDGGAEVMLLRLDSLELSAEYIARTAHIPTFTLNTSAPLMDEAARYLRWVKGTKGLPRPRLVRTADAALRGTARDFAALVDLPHAA